MVAVGKSVEILENSVSSLVVSCIQPADMSLDEIESRLGSLLQADTISQLKSGVWKERLEGLLFLSFMICFLFDVLCFTQIGNMNVMCSLGLRHPFESEQVGLCVHPTHAFIGWVIHEGGVCNVRFSLAHVIRHFLKCIYKSWLFRFSLGKLFFL